MRVVCVCVCVRVEWVREGRDSGVEEAVPLVVLPGRTEPTCSAWGATDKGRTLFLL